MGFMSDNEAKNLICEYGKRIYQKGYVGGNSGNISYRVSENEVWVTPTMESKGFLNSDMLVKVDLGGNQLSKSEYRSSSETKMHLGVMKSNNDWRCVIHAHPPFSTTLAIVGKDVDSSLVPEALYYFGDLIPVAPYAMPGTEEMAEVVIPFTNGRGRAVLLKNHGILTWGKTIKDAWFTLEVLENYCQIFIMTKYTIGQFNCIPGDLVAKFKQVISKKH